jgi:hypothetical protein
MRRLLLVLLMVLGCSTNPSVPFEAADLQIEVLQGGDEAPPTYLYTVLVSNVSGRVMVVNSISIEAIGSGDVRFKNGRLTPLTTLEPAQQGEFRLFVDVESDSGFFDREGPATLRVVVSYAIEGATKTRTDVIRVARPQNIR